MREQGRSVGDLHPVDDKRYIPESEQRDVSQSLMIHKWANHIFLNASKHFSIWENSFTCCTMAFPGDFGLFLLIMHFIFGKDLWKLRDLNQSKLNLFHHWISLLFKWIVLINLCYFWTTSNATILALNLLLDTFWNIWSESILASTSQTTCIECTLCIITEKHPTCLLDSLQEKKNWHFPLSEQRWHHLPPLCCCNLCNRVKMRSSSLMIWTCTRARRPVRLHPGILTFSLLLFLGVVFIVQKQKPKGWLFTEQELGMFSFHKILIFFCVWLLLRCLRSLRHWQMIVFHAAVVFPFSDWAWAMGPKEGLVLPWYPPCNPPHRGWKCFAFRSQI